MEETLVSFETAKLAKKKGFNKPSSHLYTIGFNSIREDKIVRAFANYEDNSKLFQFITLSKSQPHLALAPTQSLLQKWLREVHNIVITCASMYENEKNENIVYWFWIQGSLNEDENDELSFKTYEEALEAGLQAGLELIPHRI